MSNSERAKERPNPMLSIGYFYILYSDEMAINITHSLLLLCSKLFDVNDNKV